MKTNESTVAVAPAVTQPGNLSTRQLAAALVKAPSEPATSATAPVNGKEGAEGTSPATRRERSPAGKGETGPRPQEKDQTPEKLETPNAETQAAEGTEGTEAAQEPATAESTEQAAETAEAEATTEAEAEPPAETAKPGLPEELKDAIELAKGDGKKGVAKLLERVHKIVDERDTARNARLQAEEQNQQLRKELTEARQAGEEHAPVADGAGPHPEVAKVKAEIAQTDHWLGWCEDNAQGGKVPDGKGGELELDAKAVRQLYRDLTDKRQELVATKVQTETAVKQQYDGWHQKFHAEAVKVWPWLSQPQSPEYQEMQTILKTYPALKSSPDFEVVIGHYFRGRAVYQAEQKARAALAKNGGVRKPAPAREPTRVATAPPGGTVDKTPKGDQDAAAAEQQFKSSGSTKDLAKMFAARGRAVRSR